MRMRCERCWEAVLQASEPRTLIGIEFSGGGRPTGYLLDEVWQNAVNRLDDPRRTHPARGIVPVRRVIISPADSVDVWIEAAQGGMPYPTRNPARAPMARLVYARGGVEGDAPRFRLPQRPPRAIPWRGSHEGMRHGMGRGRLGWVREDGIEVPGNEEQTEWIWDAAIAAADDLVRLSEGAPPPGCPDARWLCRQRAALLRIFRGPDWEELPRALEPGSPGSNLAYYRQGFPEASATLYVEALQGAMGIGVDGDWGPNTNDALALWILEPIPGFVEGRPAAGGGRRRRTPARDPDAPGREWSPPVASSTAKAAGAGLLSLALIGAGAALMFYDN